jgi:hypothetical protein
MAPSSDTNKIVNPFFINNSETKISQYTLKNIAIDPRMTIDFRSDDPNSYKTFKLRITSSSLRTRDFEVRVVVCGT